MVLAGYCDLDLVTVPLPLLYDLMEMEIGSSQQVNFVPSFAWPRSHVVCQSMDEVLASTLHVWLIWDPAH